MRTIWMSLNFLLCYYWIRWQNIIPYQLLIISPQRLKQISSLFFPIISEDPFHLFLCLCNSPANKVQILTNQNSFRQRLYNVIKTVFVLLLIHSQAFFVRVHVIYSKGTFIVLLPLNFDSNIQQPEKIISTKMFQLIRTSDVMKNRSDIFLFFFPAVYGTCDKVLRCIKQIHGNFHSLYRQHMWHNKCKR